MLHKEIEKKIFVYADWKELKKPILMGILNSVISRGKEIFSFEYNKDWLHSEYAQVLDPDLQLFEGRQYTRDEKINFGVFLDSSPDRWGKLLMSKRETESAKKEKREPKVLSESDYLLGVNDRFRIGALRFKEDIEGPFLSYNIDMPIPHWTDIRNLEYASLHLENENNKNNSDYIKWLDLLIAPGSSLGGARPKAGISDEQNNLWIAKFPGTKDKNDMGIWEYITNILATRSGIKTAKAKILKLSDYGHTYLSKRFDRDEKGRRIHFASAMNMLGYTDNTDNVSYLEIAEFLLKYGCNLNADLEELWKRIVFNICVRNTDDHLRNHGFILTPSGWSLSPVYDVNPNPYGRSLKLNISETDNSLDLDLAMSVAVNFRVKPQRAKEIVNTIKHEVKGWYSLAKKYKVPKSEQEFMSAAFRNI